MRRGLSVILLLAVLAAGWFGYDRYYNGFPDKPDENIAYKNGNSTGNIANAGYLVRYRNELFGDINPKYQGIYKSDLKFKKQVKLTDDMGLFLNTDGEWIYYVNTTDRDTIYRVRINGKDRTRLNRTQSDCLNWENGWLYYLDRGQNSTICKLSSDGKTSQVLLAEQYCSNMLVKDGWIYFVQGGMLQRINIDGGNRKKLAAIRTTSYDEGVVWKGNYDISGYFIYYPGEDGGLYRIRIDGKQEKPMKRGKIESINIYNNFVYFYNSTQKTVYRFSIDDPYTMEYVIGGGLYYNLNIVNNDGVLYKDKAILDGPLYMVQMDLSKKPPKSK